MGRQRPIGLRRTLLALLIAAFAMALLPSGPLAAQPGESPSTRLILSTLTGIVGPGSVPEGVDPPQDVLLRVLVEHQDDEPLVDAELVVETFVPVDGRDELQAAFTEGPSGTRTVIQRLPVRAEGPVLRNDIAVVDAFVPVASLGSRGRTTVHPVLVSLTLGTDVLDSITTAVVHLEQPPSNPLPMVVVWPLDTAPTRLDDDATGDLADELAPDGRLERILGGLEVGAAGGIIPSVSAHLVEALAAAAEAPEAPDPDTPDDPTVVDEVTGLGPTRATELLTRIRSVLAGSRHAPLTTPYAEPDIGALADHSETLAQVAAELAQQGPRRLETATGVAPDPSALVTTAPLTVRSLDRLPADHLLLPASRLRGEDQPRTLRQFRALSGRLLTASVADPGLSDATSDASASHGTVAAVQRIVAETAVTWLAAGDDPHEPLLVMPDRDWAPSGRVVRDLASALVSAPWLELTDPRSHADAAEDAPVTQLPTRSDRVPSTVVNAVGDTLSSMRSLEASLVDPTSMGGRPTVELEDQLQRAASHWFASDVATADALVDEVAETVDRAYGTIVVPVDRGVRLVGKRQTMPVTIQRPSGDPLLVEVQLRSTGALGWPEGDTDQGQIAAGETRTISFDVVARARGDLRVDVIVRDAAGTRILGQAPLRVRSEFISRRALAVVAAAIVGLLVLNRLRRRNRGGDPPGDDGPGGSGGPDTTGDHDLAVITAHGRSDR